ncbi:MAG: VWA domain-containing protein [Clostridiales bacterium]|nr:VWA domain-containing protein [Clostridiales bacterium]
MKKKRFFASILALVLLLFCVSLPSAAFAEGAGTSPDGLVLSKTATATGNGNYKIRLEAYTTGTVTTTTSTVPVDIVLVLDQSGSMAYDFDGNSRQYALKQAVNNFIGAVNEKYDAEDADHRMAIVTFGSGASTLQGWTYVDTNGKNTLQGKINGLPNSPSGATNAGAGMQQAEALMGNGYNYTGNNTTRQKVVVFFTDGVPTTSSDFDTGVADAAITAAKRMKGNGVTVFSIGIFSGANPNEMYGASGFDTDSNGTIGSKWIKDTWALFPGTDFPEADRPAANRFLNLLSSNFQNATGIGLNRETDGLGILHYKITYTITSNFDRTASSYYLTANNAASLNGIFQTISQNIQTADISLDSSTVVKDIISPYFTAPANANDIMVYTAAYQGGNNWGEDTPSILPPEIDNGSVIVTGFDFNANFITENPKEDGTNGNKLVIEFTVAPKEGFLGGNDVPTNGTKSGVYADASDDSLVEAFDVPTVNVPIATPEFEVNNKTIYEGNSTAVSGLYTLPDYTGDNAWKAAYVNVTTTGTTADETVSPTVCTDYTVTVTYAPKTDGSQSQASGGGAANAMAGVSTGKNLTVHVLHPVVTAAVHDVEKYYGESYTLGDGADGSITLNWEDEVTTHTDIPAVEGTALYTETAFHLEYAAAQFGGTVPKNDFDVTVTVKKGTEEVTGATITTTCGISGSNCATPATDGVYTVHVKTCQLTIIKSGGDSSEPYVFSVMKDGKKYSEVTVMGNNSETIYELPVGSYTIAEDTGWSWRYTPSYTPSYSDGVTLSAATPNGTITCTNTKTGDFWLNGFSAVLKNIFGIAG